MQGDSLCIGLIDQNSIYANSLIYTQHIYLSYMYIQSITFYFTGLIAHVHSYMFTMAEKDTITIKSPASVLCLPLTQYYLV